MDHSFTSRTRDAPLPSGGDSYTLYSTHHEGRFFLSFADRTLEARYQAWQSKNYRRSLHMRLLIATFTYFVLAVAFTAWAHLHSTVAQDWPHLMTVADTTMGIALSVCFALSFCQCTAKRPQIFSSIVLLVTIGFVVLRSTMLDIAAVYSAPVLLVLIVCLLLGSTLLRMPCVSTLLVGLLTTCVWGTVALLELRRAPDGSVWEPVALFMVVGASTIAAGQLERLQRHLFLILHTRTPSPSFDARTSSAAAAAAPLHGLAVDMTAAERGAVAPAYARCANSELLGPLLAPPAARAQSEGDVVGGACLNAAPLATARGGGGAVASAPLGLDAHGGASALEGLRDAARDLVQQLATPQGATSMQAVQHALQQSGNASLAEYLSKLVAERSLLLAERLHLPVALPQAPRAPADAAAPADAPADAPTLERFELVTKQELPPWFTPYPFVHGGYRTRFSYRLCWLSLFRLHNETLNVWTELLPAVGFALWTAEFLAAHRDAATEDRYLVAAGLVASCVVRPLCSGLAHLFHATSASGYIFWWSVDYVSICLAILASSIVSGRLAFYCLPPLQILFFTSSAGLLSSSLVAVLAISSATLRAASFILFVLFCNGVPFCYTVGVKISVSSRYHRGQDVPWQYVYLWALSLGTFAAGLVIKSAMVPERFLQSRCSDRFLTSHQLWHLAINGAFAVGTFMAWDVYLDWRRENACPKLGV